MQILLKLTLPDKLIKDLDQCAEKLWPEYCWWDIVNRQLKDMSKRIGGKIEFVKIIKERWWGRNNAFFLFYVCTMVSGMV